MRAMSRGGAPTGKWATTPEHLKRSGDASDLARQRARLLVRRPNVPEVEIPLEKSEFVIGRQTSDVDLTLDDDLVSRRHARLTVDARGYFRLEDLGSRNGIVYQGRTVRRLNLVDGDRFSIGKTEFTFHAHMDRFKPVSGPTPRAESMIADVPVPEPEPLPVPEPSTPGGQRSRTASADGDARGADDPSSRSGIPSGAQKPRGPSGRR